MLQSMIDAVGEFEGSMIGTDAVNCTRVHTVYSQPQIYYYTNYITVLRKTSRNTNYVVELVYDIFSNYGIRLEKK